MQQNAKPSILPAICVVLLAAAGQASAATGAITLTVNGSGQAPIAKSSNISGPTFLRGTGSFTATFTSATSTSGYISADLTDSGYESTCDSTFVTVVTNGVCRVTLQNTLSGQGKSACTFSLGTVNAQTCDFTASFTDTPGLGSGPPH